MMKETKRNSLGAMIITQLLLLLLQLKSTESVDNSTNIALPWCPKRCGDIDIPYPFGIGRSCSLSEEFNVTCKKFNNGTSIPYLYEVEILSIDRPSGQARINTPISSSCYNITTQIQNFTNVKGDFSNTPFWLSTQKNRFTVIGCNALAVLYIDKSIDSYPLGCLSKCDSLETLNKYEIYGSCSGIGCCQTPISTETKYFFPSLDSTYRNSKVYNFSRCSHAMVIEIDTFKFDITNVTTDDLLFRKMPVVVNWAIGNTTCDIAQKNKSSYACKSSHSECINPTTRGGGYLCNCSVGFQGNPYLEEGCEDIDECAAHHNICKLGKCHNSGGSYRCVCFFDWRPKHNNQTECQFRAEVVIGPAAGIVALLFLGVSIYVIRERRNLSKVKEKYFRRHGGWILLEKIKSNQGFGFTIYTKQQVEQATNNFHSANILGHGGQGTVYKGTLRDQPVAIKKCKIVDESNKKEFGKEMLILSQINHKNIVKILGCCLEVEVPMLIYEFIPNCTLYHQIHSKKQGSHMSLATRLRIAHDSAEALAYLHTSASPPIFHGDVKSANILLDHNYTAKVSDFGASILAPTDEAQLVSFVQGTCGYLDPEYLQSCQLTSKSDVYSFGVVLLELLTSKPVIDFDGPEKTRSLSSRFLRAMEEKNIYDLLDEQIICEADMKLITQIAELATQCLNMKGNERPTMKRVAEEIDRISKFNQHPWRQEYHNQDEETLIGEASHDIEIEHI